MDATCSVNGLRQIATLNYELSTIFFLIVSMLHYIV